jgi:hypothetical protein
MQLPVIGGLIIYKHVVLLALGKSSVIDGTYPEKTDCRLSTLLVISRWTDLQVWNFSYLEYVKFVEYQGKYE